MPSSFGIKKEETRTLEIILYSRDQIHGELEATLSSFTVLDVSYFWFVWWQHLISCSGISSPQSQSRCMGWSGLVSLLRAGWLTQGLG